MSQKNDSPISQLSETRRLVQNKFENIPSSTKISHKSAHEFHGQQLQVPTPEPRKKITYIHNPVTRRSSFDIGTESHQRDDDGGEVKLVKVSGRSEGHMDIGNTESNFLSKIRQFDDTQKHASSLVQNRVKYFGDEGMGNSLPTNEIADYDDDDDDDDDDDNDDDVDDYTTNEEEQEYYEEEDSYESSEHHDELTNLSRQTMVPLHELIAYYKYIQQDNSQVSNTRGQISRQPSGASDKLTDSSDPETKKGSGTKNTVHESGKTESQSPKQIADLDVIHKLSHEKLEAFHPHSENIRNERQEKLNHPGEHESMKTEQGIRRRKRANVVSELINSERDFVKHLKDVVEGYLHPARKHPEIFTGVRINTIFSNIEQLYEFQRKFLESLESSINWDDLALSEVGHCFLEYETGFSVYYHYCNNHPNAIDELRDLYTRPRFVKFFEACRLLQNMIDISLDGFLLTPIQKICKYPLQLHELLRNTDQDHPDYQYVVEALESMRNCANLANERKRRIEALADVISFQEKIENWWGPPLSETSSILIHSGEVSKMSSHTWSQGIQLHLFDHLLLISKKDLLKRNNLILKARVCMDTVTRYSDADEYKPKRSFKLYCGEQQRWFVFTTRSEKERDDWIRSFDQERSIVEADELEGFHMTDREIGVARRALQNRKHSRSARYRHKRLDTAIVDQLDLDDANTMMNRTLSLPSCIHPSHVMNFVEDSKVVPSKKKDASPNASTRSPVTGSQCLNDQESQNSGSWFRKMGSKKLNKSQIYKINIPSTLRDGKSPKPSATSPTNIVLDTTAKFDQLEKKHRDHMVSDEQARLFRLNNDLPPPIFGSIISSPTMSNDALLSRPPMASKLSLYRQSGTLQNARHHSSQVGTHPIYTTSNPQSTFDKQDRRPDQKQSVHSNSEHSFETTVVLASGKVVTVREDSV